MKHKVLLSFCVVLSACATTSRPVLHASPEEAARLTFPLEIPSEGRHFLEGNTAAALQLALEAFLPRDANPSSSPVDSKPCVHRRESYDVTTAPGPEGVMLVRFVINPGSCETGESIVDVTTYAVDIRTMRILSVEEHTRPQKGG